MTHSAEKDAHCAVVGCDEEALWWSAADEVWFCGRCAVANIDPPAMPEPCECGETYPCAEASVCRARFRACDIPPEVGQP